MLKDNRIYLINYILSKIIYLMRIDDTFHGLSTLIQTTTKNIRSTGSGFFYHQLGEKAKDDSNWTEVKDVWVVTNRHVILPKIGGQEFVPDNFIFNLRKHEGNAIVWSSIKLDKEQLLKRAKFHSNKNVDVGIVKIHDLLTDKAKNNEYLQWSSVSKENLPGNNNIDVEVADDVVAIGYPRGFYDEFNVFPIVKTGTIATRWGANFNGHPYFLIDAKLFPGSSGSIVVSKPKDITVKDGKLLMAKEKQFAFLGIYSGEPFYKEPPIESDEMTIILKSTFNVGTVWYGSLVEEIIEKGKHLT